LDKFEKGTCPECEFKALNTARDMKKSESPYMELRQPDDDENLRDYLNSLAVKGAFRGDALRRWVSFQREEVLLSNERDIARRYKGKQLCQRRNPVPNNVEPNELGSWDRYAKRVVQPYEGIYTTSFEDARSWYLWMLDQYWLLLGDFEEKARCRKSPPEYKETESEKESTPYPRAGVRPLSKEQTDCDSKSSPALT
jgi:hypothetical protein